MNFCAQKGIKSFHDVRLVKIELWKKLKMQLPVKVAAFLLYLPTSKEKECVIAG